MVIHDENFALLITWTCYGTWLPGDRRGYVSNVLHDDHTTERKHNIVGTPYTKDNVLTRQRAARAQKYATSALSNEHAAVAAHSIVEACESRSWRVLRAALMWNHVHVVVTNCPDNGPEVRRIVKGVSQNALCNLDGESRRWWTAGGSNRYLHGEEAILAAINYVANQPQPLAEIIDMQVILPSERRGLSPLSSDP